MKIYNASPSLYTGTGAPWHDFTWIASNDVLYDPGDNTGPPVQRPEFADIVLSWPDDVPVGINFEPASGAWEYLNPELHTGWAVTLRLELIESIQALRPGLDITLYTLPGLQNKATGSPAEAVGLADIEANYVPVSEQLWCCGFSAYNKGIEWPKWYRRIDWTIGVCSAIHNRLPLAFVWDGHSGWQQPMPIDEFRRILEYLHRRDIDIVYWSPWHPANARPVQWQTQMALWEYAQK